MNTKRFAVLFAVVLPLALPATVTAVVKNWNVGSGNWNVAGNWSPTGVPVANDDVRLTHTDGTNRTVTYNYTGGAITLESLHVNLTNFGATSNTTTLSMPANNLTVRGVEIGTTGRGVITQSGGTHTVGGIGIGDMYLGFGAGSNGTYNLSGAGVVNSNGHVYVGYSGTGTFNQSGGSVAINNRFLDLGRFNTVTGTYNLSSGSLTATEEYIGDEGTGIFNQTGGTNTVTGAAGLALGWNTTGDGTYNLSGGTLGVSAGPLVVGRANAGRLNISNGASATSVTGIIGQLGGSQGFVDVDGANSRWTTTGSLIIGNSGEGHVYIGTGGTVHVGTNLSINASSTVNLSGGTLRFNTVGGAGGLNNLFYNAGTIQLAGNRNLTDATITTLYGANPTIPIGKELRIEGNASINQFSESLHVDGGRFSSGTLFVEKTGIPAFVDVVINNGGEVHTNGTAFIGNTVGTGGTVDVSGTGSAWHIDSGLIVGNSTRISVVRVLDGAFISCSSLSLREHSQFQIRGGTLRTGGVGGLGTFFFSSGTIQFTADSEMDVYELHLNSDAFQFLEDGSKLVAGKELAFEGILNLMAPVRLDGGTLTAGQILNFPALDLDRGAFNLTNQAVTIGSGGLFGSTLDVNQDLTINVALGITNQGLVTGDGQLGGKFTNASTGELRAQAGRSLRLTGTGNTNAGQIKLFGGELEFTEDLTNNAGATISGNGSLITGGLTNHGTMNFAGTANIVGGVTNSATGRIVSGGGGATIFYDDVLNNGEIRTSTNGFTVFFGDVTGGGSFTGTGTVNFEGSFSPGNSPAAVSFAGDVVLGAAATLEIELGGAAPGSGYDQINVTGTLVLDGTLKISFLDGFTPTAGQSFDFINAANLVGEFSSFDLPVIPGLSWDTSLVDSNGVLSLTAAGLPGDFNRDNSVDAADYVLWRKTGMNGQDGYNTWNTHFGQSFGSGMGALSSPGTIPVPEPASAGLLALGIAVFLLTPRRQTRVVQKRCELQTVGRNGRNERMKPA